MTNRGGCDVKVLAQVWVYPEAPSGESVVYLWEDDAEDLMEASSTSPEEFHTILHLLEWLSAPKSGRSSR